jgi:N-acetylmuramic acid 6-phosphate etherase
MVKLGRVYGGLMVGMRASNDKLRRRAESIVGRIAGCSEADAARFVRHSEGDVKVAILLALGWAEADAAEMLERHGGNLRLAINELDHKQE